MPRLMLILLIPLHAIAADWWIIPRQEGPTHISYVASSEGEAPLEELKEKAFMAAAAIIVREHFGTTVEASESVIEETGNSKYQFITKARSDPMVIRGLKLTDLKVLEAGAKTRLLVRVEISKEDLAQAVKGKSADFNENIYGRGKGDNFVAVKTNPQGALIQITGIDKRYFVQGHGDAKFYLPLGDYQITINEEGHAPMRKKIKIDHHDEELYFELEPLLGKLALNIDPSDAVIEPLKPTIGQNPYYLRPNQKYRFRVSHPDYFQQEFEYSMPNDQAFTKTIRLQRKSSSVRFRITPESSFLSINNRHYKNGERIELEEEELNIIVEAKGYERYEKKILIGPNRYYPDEFIKLTPEKEDPSFEWPELPSVSFFSNDPLIIRWEYNPYVKIDEKSYFSIVPVSFFIEKGFFGAGVSYNYIDFSEDDGEKITQNRISDFSLSLRFAYKGINSLVPYLALTTGTYLVDQSIDDLETIQEERRKYAYHGIGLGLRYYFSTTSSVHAELTRINKELKESENIRPDEPSESSEVKAVLGLGWEY